jgi:energy-coupling factor transporter ATP-binding protein EcfA2
VKIRRVGLRGVGPFREQIFDFGQGNNPDLADVVLLTGPNGSGKTSLLYALGAALGGSEELEGRWTAASAVTVELQIANETRFVHAQRSMPLGPLVLEFSDASTHPMGPGPWIWVDQHTGPAIVSAEYRMGEVALTQGPVFAYSAFRLMPQAPREQLLNSKKQNPLVGAGEFAKSIPVGAFDQWIIETQTKSALATKDGDSVAAARYERSIATVEDAISEVIGKKFKLQVDREPRFEVVGMLDGLRTPLEYLPDGLRSLLAWIGDVLRRLDWLEKPAGVDGRLLPIIILLDEIEVHLHPTWQRAVLPVAQRLFPNAQIIVSTHSPFVVQSADDAVVIRLGPGGELLETQGPQIGRSYRVVLEEILGYSGTYDTETDKDLQAFESLVHQVLAGEDTFEQARIEARRLAESRPALNSILGFHLAQLRERVELAN